MRKVKITDSQRLMLESLDGVNLHEVTSEEIPGIAQNEKTGKYHMALITRDGYIRALEPNFGQFIFDDSKSAKQYFCANTERIEQVLGDDDMMEGFKMSEGSGDYKTVASIDICKVSESIPPSQSPSRKITQQFSKINGFQAESEFETAPAEWGDVVSQSHEFLKKIYTNPTKEGLDPFWGEHGITWDEMIRMLTNVEIIKSVEGGYRLTKFVKNPTEAVKVTAKLLMKMIEKENAPEPVGEDENRRFDNPEYGNKYDGMVKHSDDEWDRENTNDNDMDSFTDPITGNAEWKYGPADAHQQHDDEMEMLKTLGIPVEEAFPTELDEVEINDITPTYMGKDLPTEPKRTGKTREQLLKVIALKRAEELKRRGLEEEGGYPAGAEHDPEAPYNKMAPTISAPEEPMYDKFEVIGMGQEIVILKAKNQKLFAYYYIDTDREVFEPYAARAVIDVEHSEDGPQEIYSDNWELDADVVERFLNDNIDDIQVSTEPDGWADGDKIALITPEIKQEIMGTWGNEELIANALGGIGESGTGTVGSSGQSTGALGKGTIMKSNVASQMADVIGEVDETATLKKDIITTLKGLVDINPSMIKWMSYEGKLKEIVDKIQSLNDDEWNLLIGFIIKALQTAEANLKKKDLNALKRFREQIGGLKRFIDHFSSMDEATTTGSAGGDSGTFAFDDPEAIEQNNFMMAGNKQNKGMPMVRKGGVNEDAKTDTQYPNGEFVEFDDCTKLNNNKVAQNGGCSTGAVDNVVKTKGSKNSVISDSSIYENTLDGEVITEALKLQHDTEKKTLIVISDLEGKAASKETFTNKNVLKKNGFRWTGKVWAIEADKLDVAKKTLSLINKADYLIDKLEDVEEAIAGSSADNKDLLTARLDQYIMDLANATDEVALSAEIRRYLTFFANFHQYSFYNKILIYIQNPKVTKVASKGAWFKKHRKITNWKNAITILAPMVDNRREKVEPAVDPAIKAIMGDRPKYDKHVSGFRAVKVFDIADTEAINEKGEVPESPKWHSDNEPSETADILYNAVVEMIKNMGAKVTSADSRRGEKGFSAGDHINISSDVAGAGRLSTMVHEVAHELMHWKKSSIYFIDNYKGGGNAAALMELQAESVSYVVLKHYDIPVTHHTTYLALWKANKEKIQQNLQIISNVSKFIIEKIDEEVASKEKLTQTN